jgi:N-acetylmuramoyl-L-alanine amidase
MLLISAVSLTGLIGCQPGGKVIDTLPGPAVAPIQVSSPIDKPDTLPPGQQTLVGKRVMIDPGHGGDDPGAGASTRSRVPEKTIVLDIGNRTAEILKGRGATVICTRSTDVFISLDGRANAADRHKVDLFVSIHADSAANRSASGTEVHIYTSPSGQSQSAARCMVAALEKAGIECRGIQRNNFHVLREHSRPGMLVESGFLTNAGDAQQLNTPAYRARLATAIADGAAAYLCR